VFCSTFFAGELKKMGLLQSPATQDELLYYERQYEAPSKGEWARTANPVDDGSPLSAARGIVLAAALGSLAWVVIPWVLM
jgi:hypothetical protein